MQSRRLYDDVADTARREAEAALALAVEYVGAIGQVRASSYEELWDDIELDRADATDRDDVSARLDVGELDRYERDIATQLEEADARFDDGLYEDVIYDRRRETHVMPEADREIDEFYNALDDAYIAVAATLDILETVSQETKRQPLQEIELTREYPDIEGTEGYDDHREAVGLDEL